MAKEIRSFRLNTGASIPSVGLGTWQAEPGVVGDAVTKAVKIGYRHIDCAKVYLNEKEIGCALKKLFDDGIVQRQELFITSKLWCSDHDPEDVPNALNQSLQDLQLEYLDLYLIHWPASTKRGSVGFNRENLTQPNIKATWEAMEGLYDIGKAKAIGVSNFSTKKLGDVLSVARIAPAVNQVECHPLWKQSKLRQFCESRGVHLSGYSPLGSPGSEFVKTQVLKHPIITEIAEKVGKTAAQVALRWGIQMGHSVLPKSTSEQRIGENFDVFDWCIPEDLCEMFNQIEQEKFFKGSFCVDEVYGAYRTFQDLWDGEI